MSKLDDLKSHVGRRVYFNMPFRTLTGVSVDSGILESISHLSCVVRWDKCSCLDAHGLERDCSYTERISIFVVTTENPALAIA